MHAVMAEYERDQISARTRAALAAAKARGIRLGSKGADNLRPNIEARRAAADKSAGRLKGIISGFRARGLTHRAMAEELNGAGVTAPRGGAWTHGQVQMTCPLTPSSGKEVRGQRLFDLRCRFEVDQAASRPGGIRPTLISCRTSFFSPDAVLHWRSWPAAGLEPCSFGYSSLSAGHIRSKSEPP